jgi:hypothetical protein
MTEVEKNAAPGDEVAVLGNANGDRVITPFAGKLVAIGPDRVEVTAEFVKGNSGSPIIHLKSGKLLGIATYAHIVKVDSITGRPLNEPEVKRFGYRLDSVTQWQPVVWPAYSAEFAVMDKIKVRTGDFERLLRTSKLLGLDYKDPAIRTPLERFENAVRGRGFVKTDPLMAARDLNASLHNACDTDVAQASLFLRYDFFRHELEEQQKHRRELSRGIDDLVKKIPK